MQTPAEKYIVETLRNFLFEYYKKYNDAPKMLNIGAGENVVIEDKLCNSGFPFMCDRADIDNFQIGGHNIRNCYECSVDSMNLIKSKEYNTAFCNYLLEHVQNLNKAALEIYRVLKPGGIFVTSVPNPTALEFVLAKLTPLWFHEMVRGGKAWETHYSFKNINSLKDCFQDAGFNMVEIKYWSFIESYLKRFFVLNKIAILYDKCLNNIQIKKFMNNVCIVFQKPF